MLHGKAWFGFLLSMLSQAPGDGPDSGLPAWPKPGMLAIVTLGAIGVICFTWPAAVRHAAADTWAATALMTAVFGLVLLELFYRAVIERSPLGASSRWRWRWAGCSPSTSICTPKCCCSAASTR